MVCKFQFIVVFKDMLTRQLQINTSFCSTLVERLIDGKLEIKIMLFKSFTVVNNLLRIIMSFNPQNYRLSEKKLNMYHWGLAY